MEANVRSSPLLFSLALYECKVLLQLRNLKWGRLLIPTDNGGYCSAILTNCGTIITRVLLFAVGDNEFEKSCLYNALKSYYLIITNQKPERSFYSTGTTMQ